MKDHPPIKRQRAMLSFSRDHHFGLLLVWKIRQGLDKRIETGRVSDYVLFFYKEDLETHFRDEEGLLFRRMPLDDIIRKQAELDHQDIRWLMASLRENKTDPDLLRAIANKLEQHIRFEERILFNYLEEILSQAELEEVACRSAGGDRAPCEAWLDTFWLK